MADQLFSDGDHAFLRDVEFGELPPRVRPEEYVELIETEPKRDRPEPAGSLAQSQATQAGA